MRVRNGNRRGRGLVLVRPGLGRVALEPGLDLDAKGFNQAADLALGDFCGGSDGGGGQGLAWQQASGGYGGGITQARVLLDDDLFPSPAEPGDGLPADRRGEDRLLPHGRVQVTSLDGAAALFYSRSR